MNLAYNFINDQPLFHRITMTINIKDLVMKFYIEKGVIIVNKKSINLKKIPFHLPQIKLCLLNKQGFLKRGQRYGLMPCKDNQSTSMKYVFIYFKDKKTMFIKQIRRPKEMN
jgi:hypothetical protein